jgi:solute carrier family 32 (vesicular inhibitory amino acid transporter)
MSVIICTSVAVLTWISVWRESEDKNVTPVEEFDPMNPPLLNLLKAYGIISFQFDIHPMLLTIQVDMQDKSKIGRAVFGGLLTTCSLSLVTTLLVHRVYGQGITANVLESLPKSWTLYVIILLVTLQLCLSSAVGNSALFQHVEDFLNIPRREERLKNFDSLTKIFPFRLQRETLCCAVDFGVACSASWRVDPEV